MTRRLSWIVCAVCRQGFYSDTTDAEALEEARAIFPAAAHEGPCDRPCDPCWAEFLEWAKTGAPELQQPPPTT